MPQISALVRNKGECTVGEGENALHVQFLPNRYTPELEETYAKIMAERLPAGAMAYLLSEVLAGWDLAEEDENGDPLVDANGQPQIVSTDLERLRQLPNELVGMVVMAITNDLNASREEVKNSRRGSLTVRPPASARGGTR
jgi:hypothetical protein